jgi:uncharacterized protein (TIGR02679 family)
MDRLRLRLARGEVLAGDITLSEPSEEEQADVASLLGRRPGRGRSLTVSLDQIDVRLRELGFADGLHAAVEAVHGPVDNQREAAAAEAAEWASLWSDFYALAAARLPLLAWLEDLRESGLLVRLSRRDPATARALLLTSYRVAERLPGHGERLAALAAAITGDSHALDSGQPLSALVLRLEKHLGTPALETDDAETTRRSRWAALGVALDELSGPALAIGLAPRGDAVSARLLRLATEAGEPCLLPLRLLLRESVFLRNELRSATIFVCENPTVVSLAADRLGHRCPPLLCTQGMPGAATQLLLRQAARAGATLLYHGDFDWPGTRIANWVMTYSGARPWLYDAPNYLSAPSGPALTGAPQPTPWDSELSAAMIRRGLIVHEEALFETLLHDLESHSVAPT